MKTIIDKNTAKKIINKADTLSKIALKDREGHDRSSYLKQMFANKHGITYRPSGIYTHSNKYKQEANAFTNYILDKMP